jgi:hypothetical protein
MAKVRMLVSISGGRADQSDWPHAGEILECDDEEARELILGGNAVAAADGAERPPGAPDADGADDGPQEPENGSQPRVRDPKEHWEMHAVNLGVSAELAAAMTKADLIAQYGAPAAG